jgi:FkbM family methyltransferase
MEQTKLVKFIVSFPNKKEYHKLKKEIWGEGIYYFKSNNPSPFIIDIGSHIGISILYFKDLYPNSRILAFEPNPISFEFLKENVNGNALTNVTLVNEAISSNSGERILYIDNTGNQWNSNSSFLKNSWSGKENTKGITVKSTRLDRYIQDIDSIDMLKIDTEGSELEILNSHKKILRMVENISVEYHPIRGKKYIKILNILNEFFNIQILDEGKVVKNPSRERLLTIHGKKRE